MGYKNVCCNCRKAFNQGTDFEKIHAANCPVCGRKMFQVDHKFRPPKITNLKKWETVEFLFMSGFLYQRIYEINFQTQFVKYPENLKDAKEFVEKYKNQAYIK